MEIPDLVFFVWSVVAGVSIIGHILGKVDLNTMLISIGLMMIAYNRIEIKNMKS